MLRRIPDGPQIADPDEYDDLRETFRPKRIKILFVGESRPANGTFFYRGDSRLARYTREAIGTENGSVLDFLEDFCSRGCFLTDLCARPVNRLPPTARNRARAMGEQNLTAIVSQIRPSAVVVVMKRIEHYVKRALKTANLASTSLHVLPFPAQGHEREFVSGLRRVLDQLEQKSR